MEAPASTLAATDVVALVGATEASPAAAALAVIEVVERMKSHLDALVLPAWRMLHAAYVEALESPERPPMTARERERETSVARSGAVDEVMAASGLGESECRRRLGLALADPVRVDSLVRLLAAGELALWQVLGLHDDTADLDPTAADEVVQVVSAPTRAGDRPSAQLRRRRLRRELARRGAQSACGSRRLAARDARAELEPDGTGRLWITGEGGRVVAAIERVDRLARGIRASGQHPDRTLAQLRSDVALDLILHTTSVEGAEWSRLGDLPPAQVQVVIGLDVLSGATDGVAEIPGHGWVPADVARDLAHAPGSVWQRLVIDPATGALVELSSTRYTPPARLRAHVVARDRVCRAPGCVVPATTCDLDHDIPWPMGVTSADNLTAKHRRHHQLKTVGLWSSRHDPTMDALTWTTLAGRSYRTDPFDYREVLDADLDDGPLVRRRGAVPAERHLGAVPTEGHLGAGRAEEHLGARAHGEPGGIGIPPPAAGEPQQGDASDPPPF